MKNEDKLSYCLGSYRTNKKVPQWTLGGRGRCPLYMAHLQTIATLGLRTEFVRLCVSVCVQGMALVDRSLASCHKFKSFSFSKLNHQPKLDVLAYTWETETEAGGLPQIQTKPTWETVSPRIA